METVLLDTPAGITARLGWDPSLSVHDRRRIIAKELIADRLGCEPKDVVVMREDPRGFGYHTRLIASHGGEDLPLAIHTASYRAATVIAIGDPELPVGIDIRDLHPEPTDLHHMQRHSHLIDKNDVADLVQHWVRVQAVLEADGRGVRVAPEHVMLNSPRTLGWLLDRKARYGLVDLSRDGWLITLAHGSQAKP